MTEADNESLIRNWLRNADSRFSEGFEKYIAADYEGYFSGLRRNFAQLLEGELLFAHAFTTQREIHDVLPHGDKIVFRITTCKACRPIPGLPRHGTADSDHINHDLPDQECSDSGIL